MTDIIQRIGEYNKFGSKLGLQRMEALLSELGNPEKDLQVIHVAGTNGKGSTCKYLYEVLLAAGYTAGLYISPFIEVFNERIQLNGAYISDEDLTACGEEVLAAVKALKEKGQEEPTEFEIVTALAFVYYAKKSPDFVILEVGLGGSGDSTNVIKKPAACLITSIDYDHMDRLGNTLTEIATNKAGIIKEKVPVLINVESEEAKKVLARTAYAKGTPLYDISDSKISNLTVSWEGTVFDAIIKGKRYQNVHLSMAGSHQAQNACLALATIEVLRKNGIISIGDNALAQGLQKAGQPGRFEVFKAAGQEDKYFVLDGAHNPEGMEALLSTLDAAFYGRKKLAVFGILADKSVDNMLFFAEQMADEFMTVTVGNERTLEGDRLAQKLAQRGNKVTFCESAAQAVQRAADKLTGDYDVCLFAGSLYLISEIRRLLQNGYI